jgi:hypothetical protein
MRVRWVGQFIREKFLREEFLEPMGIWAYRLG